MHIGIFAKTFVRPTLAATLDAVVAHGLDTVQFNLSCAGLPTLPDQIDPAAATEIQTALAVRGLEMAAISGTVNLIHPAVEIRDAGLRRLRVLIEACRQLGTGIVTLCTGTRDPENMWRRHPENDSPAAWADLLAALAQVLPVAERHGVILGVEPEVANVVDSAPKARLLLDTLRSPALKIVMDGANLFHTGELARMTAILDEAFALLGPDLTLAHAKDLSSDGAAGHAAAGTGVLDYERYLALLRQAGYPGPLILHGLAEAQVSQAIAFLVDKGCRLR